MVGIKQIIPGNINNMDTLNSCDTTAESTNQDHFLQHYINFQTLMSVFLTSGLQLKGVIMDYDDNTLFLQDRHSTQQINKHAVASIMPQKERSK